MKWVSLLVLLIVDIAGGWFIWLDTQNDWNRKLGSNENFFLFPLGESEKIVDEEGAAALLNTEWQSSLPDIL